MLSQGTSEHPEHPELLALREHLRNTYNTVMNNRDKGSIGANLAGSVIGGMLTAYPVYRLVRDLERSRRKARNLEAVYSAIPLAAGLVGSMPGKFVGGWIADDLYQKYRLGAAAAPFLQRREI